MRTESSALGRPRLARSDPTARRASAVAERPYGRFFPFAVIAVAAAVTVALWYRGQPLLWGIDATGPLTLDDISQYFRLTDLASGAPDARKLAFVLPIALVLRAWHLVGLPYSAPVVQPVLVFALLAGGASSMYWLIRTCLPQVRRAAALAGALVYVFNLFALTVIWTPLSNLIFHYSLLPLVFCLLARALRQASFTLALAAGLVWSITLTPGYVTPPLLLTDLLLFASVLALELRRASAAARVVRLLGVTGLVLMVWLGVNLFWLVPDALYAQAEIARGLGGLKAIDIYTINSAHFDGAIRLGGYWGLTSGYKGTPYFSWATFYTHGLGAYLGFLLPILAFAGAVWRPPRRVALEDAQARTERDDTRLYLILFGTVAVIAVVLMTGAYAPLGSFKVWFMGKLGLAGPFRSTYQRFGIYASFAYAPLVAAGLERWTRRAEGTGRAGRNVAGALPATGILLLVVALAWPMWTGATYDGGGILPSSRVAIPPEYPRVARWLDGQNGDFNVLVYPFGSRGVVPLDWRGGRDGYIGAEPLALLSGKPFVAADAQAPYLRGLVGLAARGGAGALPPLRLLNARFIVVHEDSNKAYLAGTTDWIGADTHSLENALDQTRGLKLVQANRRLHVYQVMLWRPFGVYAISGYRGGTPVYTLAVDRLRAIRYAVEGPGSYSIPGGQLRRGDTLIVNHPFDRFWRSGSRPAVRVSPGLTGFRDLSTGEVTVSYRVERRLQALLLLAAATFAAAVLALAFNLRRLLRARR